MPELNCIVPIITINGQVFNFTPIYYDTEIFMFPIDQECGMIHFLNSRSMMQSNCGNVTVRTTSIVNVIITTDPLDIDVYFPDKLNGLQVTDKIKSNFLNMLLTTDNDEQKMLNRLIKYHCLE